MAGPGRDGRHHQIGEANFGQEESFTGGFLVDTGRRPGERAIYGPFQVDAGRRTIMRSASTYVATAAAHVQSSELCATCHTLYTHSLGSSGEITGRLPEQVPYLEWRHSAYRDERSCQSCHMPEIEGEAPIASVLAEPRPNFSRHVFRGGNFFQLRLLARYGNELGVTALPEELETAARRTVENLQIRTARLTIERAALAGGRLAAEVAVESLAGHKLPTAYPPRRAWLHFTVRDAAGSLLFESGALEPSGRITGNDNDVEASRFEPHHRVIVEPGQVQIYESILAGPEGAVTTGLLTASSYAKDNRLLPRGFDKTTAPADVAVHGGAAADGDFQAGGDRVRYEVEIGTAQPPLLLEAELIYQPIAYRWAENLRPYAAPETTRFVAYYESMADASAVVLARAAAEIR